MKIKWQEHSNEELLIWTKMEKLSTLIMNRIWKFIGHTLRGGTCKHLQHCIDLGTRRKKEKGQAQNNLAANCRKRKEPGWMEVMG